LSAVAFGGGEAPEKTDNNGRCLLAVRPSGKNMVVYYSYTVGQIYALYMGAAFKGVLLQLSHRVRQSDGAYLLRMGKHMPCDSVHPMGYSDIAALAAAAEQYAIVDYIVQIHVFTPFQ
jgi:hypothetical protein